jgi:SpoVK/Ycf46/Vps4 family AAA+-type ATPase
MSNPFEEINTRLTSIENRLIDLNLQKEDVDLKYLSREEVCTILKISMPTLNTYTKKGIIKGSKIGNRMLYLEADIKSAVQDATNLKYRRLRGENK